MIEVLLALCILFIGVLLVYIRWLLKKFWYFSNNLDDFVQSMDEYALVLKNVYELEMYYGDETLSELLQNTRMLSDEIEGYKAVFSVEEEEEEEEEGVQNEYEYEEHEEE